MQRTLKIKQYARREQALPNMTKPEGMSDADFTKFHNETARSSKARWDSRRCKTKDYVTAQKDFVQAVADESQPNIADIYPLATADLEANR